MHRWWAFTPPVCVNLMGFHAIIFSVYASACNKVMVIFIPNNLYLLGDNIICR